MKKLLILTSILALTACGGGGGGSGGAILPNTPVSPDNPANPDMPTEPDTPSEPDVPEVPVELETPIITETVSNDVALSNSAVTGIALDNREELITMVETALGKTYQDEEMSLLNRIVRRAPEKDNNKRWEWAKNKINHIGWFENENLTAKLNEYKAKGQEAYDKFVNDLKDAFVLIGGDSNIFDVFLNGYNHSGLTDFITGIINGDLKDKFDKTKEDMQYQQFDLGSVKFYRGNAHDAGEYIQLKLDDSGVVQQLFMSDAGTYDRDNESATFGFHGYRYEVDNHSFMSATKITTNEELRRELRMHTSIENVGDITLDDVTEQEVSYNIFLEMKGGDVGLKYSDFGQLNLQSSTSDNPGYGMFAGGYDDKKIDKSQLPDDLQMRFVGKATAVVKIGDTNEEKLLAYTDATLVFDSTNKTESLIMPFADWYDVRITRYGKNGTSFNFSNYSGGDDKWKITDDVYKQQFDVTYFSATGLPVEAVAYFGYVNKNTDDNELIFNGAFGGITDETYIPNIENYKFDISGVDFSLTNPERDEKIVFTTNDNGHIVSANLDGEIVFADENTDDNDASLVARGYNVFFERPGGGYNNYISPTPINSDEELHNFLVTIMTKQGESTQEIDYVKNLTLNDVEIKTINYSMSVQMLGANTGLKYTDIAFISLTENEGNESKTEYAYAVGGDLNKKITNVVVPNGENLSFKGTVYAAVNDLFTSDDDAELVFDTETKTETLSMNLDKWYNVMITKNGNSVAFNFSNPDNKTFDYMLNDNAEIKSEKFDTVYYGEDNIPFEATANFGYVEEYWDEEYNEYEINFLGVFGGKKQ